MTIHPIERAARALCRIDGHPEDAQSEGAAMWERYIPQVRAVLMAVRTPNGAMARAGTLSAFGGVLADVPEIWESMIDAALEHPPLR